METKRLIGGLTALVCILALVLSACDQQGTGTVTSTATTTVTITSTASGTSSADKIYKVINPAGTFVPVETKPCAPRLDSLSGKNILYYQSEANPVIMPVLLTKLQQDYPTTTFTVIKTETTGPSVPSDEIKGVDAVIRGISW